MSNIHMVSKYTSQVFFDPNRRGNFQTEQGLLNPRVNTVFKSFLGKRPMPGTLAAFQGI